MRDNSLTLTERVRATAENLYLDSDEYRPTPFVALLWFWRHLQDAITYLLTYLRV